MDVLEGVHAMFSTAELEKSRANQRPARVYKRWVIFSSVVSLLVAWAVFPIIFDYQPPGFSNLSRLGMFFFDQELLNRPGFGEQVKSALRGIMPSSISLFIGRKQAEQELEDEVSPGRKLRKAGARAFFPVVMIPGVTSTGLELWEGKKCAKPLFRQRFWGTLTMLRTLLMDKECWTDHLRLNPETGGDPEGIRIRAAQGLEAADFIMPGFWVWARIIANLAEIGYDHNSLYMASYDWRLDLRTLQERDHYFTKLKMIIEQMKRIHGKKVVVIGHSLGSQVWLYFMKWVEADPNQARDGVGGFVAKRDTPGKWIDEHIESFVNLAGPMLGAPKSISTVLSGETKDTAQLNTLEAYLLDLLLSKRERLSLFRSWMGGFAIFPKGGTTIWGSAADGIPDGMENAPGYDLLLIKEDFNSKQESFTFDQVPKVHEMCLPSNVLQRYRENYSDGIASPGEIAQNDLNHTKWNNPLESRLPAAPNMKIYCMYGIDQPTERGYIYKPRDSLQLDRNNQEAIDSLDPRTLAMPLVIDLTAEDSAQDLHTGVYHVNGDGTVPLLSLSYMCIHAWKNYSHLNPSRMKVITREYKHDPVSKIADIRGGPRSGDHVDILGNYDLTSDILRIAANFYEEQVEGSKLDAPVDDRIFSNAADIAKKIKLNF